MDLNHLNLRVADPGACRSFYLDHFEFHDAFEAEGGYFLRNDAGFLLALVPAEPHQALPPGVHIGFGLATPDAVGAAHRDLGEAGVTTTPIDDERPRSSYVTFRCWDPDGTEVEVFWEG